jgi:hypothetical protein
MTPFSRLSLGAGVALSLAALAPSSRAADPDPKRVCIDADTRAQSARRAGKLAEARAALKICTDARCPEIVRADCSQRMDDLPASQPTVVIEAKDAKGADLTDVAVYLDGQKVADSVAAEILRAARHPASGAARRGASARRVGGLRRARRSSRADGTGSGRLSER